MYDGTTSRSSSISSSRSPIGVCLARSHPCGEHVQRRFDHHVRRYGLCPHRADHPADSCFRNLFDLTFGITNLHAACSSNLPQPEPQPPSAKNSSQLPLTEKFRNL